MISVVIPAHNPHPARLARTMDSLRAQTLGRAEWELVVVDNASAPDHVPVAPPELGANVVSEPVAGLTRARLRGVAAARGDLLVFVDDDNVLDPNFLEQARASFNQHPALAAAGGRITPEFESQPPPWTSEFHGLLALRDLGPEPLTAKGGPRAPWPHFAPVGAGLCVRRGAAEHYAAAVSRSPAGLRLDRAGTSLASGGDNDLVFTALHHGGDVAYLPDLHLTHLIPAARLTRDYLARLNRGIMRSWVQVLARHGQCPWPAITRASVPVRAARAWWRLKAWRGPAAHVRWWGARGQFEGQADLGLAVS